MSYAQELFEEKYSSLVKNVPEGYTNPELLESNVIDDAFSNLLKSLGVADSWGERFCKGYNPSEVMSRSELEGALVKSGLVSIPDPKLIKSLMKNGIRNGGKYLDLLVSTGQERNEKFQFRLYKIDCSSICD